MLPLVPCLNEEVSIAGVIANFRRALPTAAIFVYDNGSTDGTVEVARAAGATVRCEPMRGKGNVVQRMFADVEADVFVLVDGDDTYDAASAPAMVTMIISQSLDLISAARQATDREAYRRGHRFGNLLLTGLVTMFFGRRLTDLLTGYRVMSRRFVKSYPALASGFEIETELSVHALQLRVPMVELSLPYKERPRGSSSKLNTYSDGLRILRTIIFLVKEEKPLAFFSVIAAAAAILSLALGIPVIIEFMRIGLVPRLPTALLAVALMLLSFLSLACGLILDSVSRGRMETKRLAYLAVPLHFSSTRRSLIDTESG